MRVLVVGGRGKVGRCAVEALAARHEILTAGRESGDLRVDIGDPASVEAMYRMAGNLDAVVAAAGHTHFGPLSAMTPGEFMKGVGSKLMGQVNLVILGHPHVNDGGSFTLVSGILNRDPIRQGANAAAIDGAIDAFVKAAALEMPRGIRINAVSPALLEISAKDYEGYFPGHIPVSSFRVGQAFVKSVEGALTGQVIAAE
jgi:NAD(P)-dependent dehydrogenase (short-subunit alcohol dehydrogenase family)